MNVLIFDRPFTRTFFSYFGEIEGIETTRISDFKFHGDYDVVSKQYEYLDRDPVYCKLSEDEVDIIIARDRFLRFQEVTLARKLVRSYYDVIYEYLSNSCIDFILGPPIDNYYLDITSKVADSMGIKNEFLIQSFLPNLTRVSKRGEYRKVRSVLDEEVEKYRDILNRKVFKPTTLKPNWSVWGLTKIYLKERIKKIYFELAKIFKRDPYSFHYNCIYPMKGAITVEGISNIGVRKKFTPIDIVEKKISSHQKDGKKVVFLPLQFSPETTIDYYINDHRFGKYNDLMEKVVASSDEEILIVVKEHPDIYGFRSSSFYDLFLDKKNVVLADVGISASHLINLCDAVLVTGGGSTGAEAVVKNKQVISLGDAYYEFGDMVDVVKDFDDVNNWKNLLTEVDWSDEEISEFVRHILENTVTGPYDFVRSKPENKERDLENVREVLSCIKEQS